MSPASSDPWEKEQIPDSAFVFRAVPKGHMLNEEDGTPNREAFKIRASDSDKAWSLYWEKYANRARKVFAHISLCEKFGQEPRVLKDPAHYTVFRLSWSDLRSVPIVDVLEHSPHHEHTYTWGIPNNRSHCGMKHKRPKLDEEEVVMLQRLFRAGRVPREDVSAVAQWLTTGKKNCQFI